MKPGALLLLLAVAASQVDLLSAFTFNISTCPLTYYGSLYSWMDVTFNADSSIDLCFKKSEDESSQDCVVTADGGGSDNVNVSIHSENITCYVYVEFFFAVETYTIDYTFYDYGPRLTLAQETYSSFTLAYLNVSSKVGNSIMDSSSLTNEQANSGDFSMDLSGCRYLGVAYRPGSLANHPDTCSNLVCNATANLDVDTICGPMEVCYGNNTCLVPVCTVTGSNVIDFNNGVHLIPDRCAYNLMTPGTGSGFNLAAVFSERRRKDRSFLDRLILHLSGPGVTIYLEQGGRVLVDIHLLRLDATAQLHHGVELSKDQTGITAKLTSFNVVLFFDGNTAHVTGPGPESTMDGLCGNPTDPSQQTNVTAQKSFNSLTDCDIQYHEPDDNTINCSRSTERCNLMMQAPFTACHGQNDPEPFIDACIDTLCSYPSVDGLDCQFIEAYEKKCSLHSNIALEDWRSTVTCSTVHQACRNQYCSNHEFCGEKLDRTPCLCRALFASKYEPTGALGEPTICMQNTAILILFGCLLEDKDIDYTTLQLNDQSCTGEIDLNHIMVFIFDTSNTCGAEVHMNDNQIFYTNTIVSANNSLITHSAQAHINFSCHYIKPDIMSASIRIRDSTVQLQLQLNSSEWFYTLHMKSYTDADLVNPISSNTEVQLDQEVWLELSTTELDSKRIAIVTKSCWATNQSLPSGSPRYDLVVNGCPSPADQTVKMQGNGLGMSNSFSFRMFKFTGDNTEIFLHCEVELCIKQGRSCAPTCGGGIGRRRRSLRLKQTVGSPALITLAWTQMGSDYADD